MISAEEARHLASGETINDIVERLEPYIKTAAGNGHFKLELDANTLKLERDINFWTEGCLEPAWHKAKEILESKGYTVTWEMKQKNPEAYKPMRPIDYIYNTVISW